MQCEIMKITGGPRSERSDPMFIAALRMKVGKDKGKWEKTKESGEEEASC